MLDFWSGVTKRPFINFSANYAAATFVKCLRDQISYKRLISLKKL